MEEILDDVRWSPVADTVRAASGGWNVAIDPAKPESAMVVTRNANVADVLSRLSDSRSAGDLLLLTIDPQPAHAFRPEEIYVRQQDLIVRYSQSEGDQFSIQLDWRLIHCKPPFSLAVEVWFSIQTQFLNTHPQIGLQVSGPGYWNHWSHTGLCSDWHDDLQSSSNCRAAHLSTDDDASFLWLVDPRDQTEITWADAPSDRRLSAQLFGQFLEKGVIRRARCRFLVASQPVDLQDVQSEYHEFAASALPLTA